MSSVPPPDVPPTPSPARGLGGPGTPAGHAGRALQEALQGALRALGNALSTPTEPGARLLGHAASRWVRLVPYVLALAFVASLLPVTVVVLIQDYGVNGGFAGVLATAQTAPLLMAVSRPLQAWWIVFTADVLGALATMNSDLSEGRPWPWTPMVVVGYLALMLTVGLREQRRTLVSVWLVTGAAGFAFELFTQQRGDNLHLVMFVLSGVVLLITGMLRERGDAKRRLVEQETISEAERARRTLLEERARIARELHDVVAHHMSVITVQADSAPYRIEGIPEAAREEFTSIAASARESLTEMRRLLAVLRSENTEGERAPQPGVDRVQQLVEATVRAGAPVELSLAAELGTVPPTVDLSAYRIVQEALSNVVRHAPGARTRVSVSRSPNLEWLIVLVVNGPPTEPTSPLETSGTGHGLVGMRERVRLTGGMLDTGPLPDGGFRVAARLPLTAPLP
ncbi:sensor histidine kinase [Streptomyces sp. TRM49041]|uniref:sensor histidine kinase n=1 Tax=Streptomyces sp. TRM49041 TaxID=2603216 RepID=UPI0011EBBDA3|nr:sensor histidine kinase [Streptomyces sp. TRM49041]